MDIEDKLRDVATCMIGIDHQVDQMKKILDDIGLENFQINFIIEELKYKSNQVKKKLAEVYVLPSLDIDSEIGKD